MVDNTSLDKDLILDLNFVPDWAKKPPAQNQYDDSHEEVKPVYEKKFNRKKERPSPRKPYVKKPQFEYVELPDVEVSFLPEQRHLVAVVKKIKASKRAYPLMDLAEFFLSSPEFHAVKVQARKSDDPDKKPVKLYQCKLCGSASTEQSKIVTHLKREHFEEFFDKEEVDSSEPPSGNFVCVAKCSLSGTLLGPTNHHTYHDKVMEVYQSKYSDMSFEDYNSMIEISHDEADINKWKEECSKKTVYKLKDDNEQEFSWLTAINYFENTIAPKNIVRAYKIIIPGKIAKNLQDRGLKVRIRNRFQRESKMPRYLSFALRAAFKHMHLYAFKAGMKEQFISAIMPTYLDPESAVDNIAKVLKHLHDNPGCTRKELLEILQPSEEEAKDILVSLSWLVEKGHIIEFFNGHLAVPMS